MLSSFLTNITYFYYYWKEKYEKQTMNQYYPRTIMINEINISFILICHSKKKGFFMNSLAN